MFTAYRGLNKIGHATLGTAWVDSREPIHMTISSGLRAVTVTVSVFPQSAEVMPPEATTRLLPLSAKSVVSPATDPSDGVPVTAGHAQRGHDRARGCRTGNRGGRLV
jgi:hypothetical protein